MCRARAPDIAVEILSPDDDQRLLDLKLGAYLRNGARLVLIVDPLKRTMEAHSVTGATTFGDESVFEHALFPGLRIDLAALFASVDRFS